jgi:hypothetical protein
MRSMCLCFIIVSLLRNLLVRLFINDNPVPVYLEPIHVRVVSLACGVPQASRPGLGWKLDSPSLPPKSSQLPCQQGIPLPTWTNGGPQMSSSRISAKPHRAPRPACRMHGPSVVAVQVAIALVLSELTKSDAKTHQLAWIECVKLPGSGWPWTSWKKEDVAKTFLLYETKLHSALERKLILGSLLVVLLVLMLIGAFPGWSHSLDWGYAPTGGSGVVLTILVVLLAQVGCQPRGRNGEASQSPAPARQAGGWGQGQ